MLFDEKGKLFGKISIIDILIVLIIIAGIGAVYYKFGRSGVNSPIFNKAQDLELTFFVEDVPDFVANSVKAGDVVKDKTSGVVIGTVKKTEIGSDVYYAPDSEGKMVKSSKEGYNSLKIYVEAKGTHKGKGATIGSADFYINRQIDVYFGDTYIFLRLSSISDAGK